MPSTTEEMCASATGRERWRGGGNDMNTTHVFVSWPPLAFVPSLVDSGVSERNLDAGNRTDLTAKPRFCLRRKSTPIALP